MMNGNLCGGFKRHRRRRSLPSDHQNKKHDNYGPPQNLTAIMTSSSAVMTMNPRSLWAAMNFEAGLHHIYTHETEADHLISYNNNNNSSSNDDDDVENTRQLTLQDWILSSPAQMKQSTRRIHPSFDGDNNLNEELLPRSSRDRDVGVSLSYELAAENGHGINNTAGHMTIMMRKKKVRFRSPEVADVFVLPPHNVHDSPQTIDRSSICSDDERPGLLLTNL